MAAAKQNTEKDPVNFVHQNSILVETIKKESKTHQIFTNYGINPFTPMYALAGKPNSKHDSAEGEEDAHFLKVIKRAQQEPVKKYTMPQTEAQEIGWISKPLLEVDTSDKRLCFRRENTEITKYMDAAWRVIEQQENMK